MIPETSNPGDGPSLLKVGDVARILNISVRSVWRYTSAGELPAPFPIGRSTRWSRGAIEEYINHKRPRPSR